MSKISHDALLDLLGRASLQTAQALALINKRLAGCVQQLTAAAGLLVLILKGNRLQMADLNALPGFQHLRWLDLSGNQIRELPKVEVWEQLTELQILYLHENLLSDWDSIRPLELLPRVLHITLFNNPIVHLLGYRHYMVSELQTLLVLDFYIVTDEERLTDVSYSAHFKTLTEITKFPLQEAESTAEEELLGLYSRTLYKLRRKYEHCSAVLRIQSLWRGYKVRKNIGGFVGKRDQAATTIQRLVRGFLLRKKLKRDLESLLKTSNKQFLLFEPEEYVKYLAVQKIESFMISKVLKKKREAKNSEVVAVTMQKYVRRWLKMKGNLPVQSNVMYVFRHQTGTLLSILRAITQYNPAVYHPTKLIGELHFPDFFKDLQVPREAQAFEAVVEKVRPCTSLKVIRFPDLDALKYSKSKAIHFTSWLPLSRLALDTAPALSPATRVSSKFTGARNYRAPLQGIKPRQGQMTRAQKAKWKAVQADGHFDDYHDLMVFEAPSLAFLHRILAIALLYNSQASKAEFPLFMPLLDQSVRKVAAVCLIQSYWRGHHQRPHPSLAQSVATRRATLCIQRWWRSLRMVKRLICLQHLNRYLALLQSPVLYLEEHTYACLNDIQGKRAGSLSVQEGQLLYKSTAGDIGVARAELRAVPDWLDLHFPSFRVEAGFTEDPLERLLTFNVDAEKTVLHKATPNKSYLSDAELPLVQLNFGSLVVAKRRAALLFFKTFDFRSNLALTLLSRAALEDDFLMPKLKKLWKVFKVDLNRIARIRERIQPVLIVRSSSPPPEVPIPTPPRPKINIEAIVKEIEANQSRGESEISSKEVAQWRIKRAREEMERKETERKTAREQETSFKLDQIMQEKERIATLLAERQQEESKELHLRMRLRSKEAETSLRIRSEREFVHSFALNCNMLSKQLLKGQLNRVKRKIVHDNSVFVKQFKEKCAKEREVQLSINYERFKQKQANKAKSTPFVL